MGVEVSLLINDPNLAVGKIDGAKEQLELSKLRIQIEMKMLTMTSSASASEAPSRLSGVLRKSLRIREIASTDKCLGYLKKVLYIVQTVTNQI